MPSYYARPPPGLPITPPDSMYYAQYPIGGNGFQYPMHEQKGYDSFNQPPPYQNTYRGQQNMPFPPGLPHSGGNGRYNGCNTLPPLKAEQSFENMAGNWSQQRADANRSAPTKAEDKPTGGVAQVLDYEIEEMTNFLCCMAIETIVGFGETTPTSRTQFKKFVQTILQSTRLPSSTIILSLDYLSQRMAKCPPQNQHKGSSLLYRMTTIALLLASKFLDDNTFQNRSWADVTGLPLSELNTLEAEWLQAIGWQLHVARPGYNGFDTWKKSWEGFLASSRPAPQPVLAPINTNVANNRRHTLSFTHQTFSPQQPQQPQSALPHGYIGDRLRQHQQQMSAMPDNAYWFPDMSSGQPSPPSAPETGPATPNWDMPMNWGPQFGGKPQQQYQPRIALGPPHSSQMYPVIHQWMPQCNCANCMPGNGRMPTPCMYSIGSNNYMMSYGQAVVG